MSEGSGATTRYSKDYWDLVSGQIRRRWSVRLSAALLALLYAVAIYAPFLANDKPLVFTGTFYGEYRASHRLVALAAAELLAKAQQGRDGFLAWQAAEQARGETLEGSAKQDWLDGQGQAPADFAAWMELDRGGLDGRLLTLRRQLAPEHHAALDAVSDAAAGLVRLAQASPSPSPEALAAAGERLTAAAGVVRDSLKAAKSGEAPEPGRTVALQAFTSYPVLEALGWNDVYFMLLWALVLLWPLINRLVDRLLLHGDLEAMRRARRGKLLLLVLLPAAGTLLWLSVHGAAPPPLEQSSLKQALAAGQAEAVSAVYPPIPFGMSEQNQTETFRPPTWWPAAAIDDEGFYLTGARSLRTDAATGMPIRATPVEVRPGEPPRNAPARRLLGTDSLGRDLLARIVWGARISLAVGIISTVLLVFIGTLFGALSGYFGGWVDVLISRIVEVFQCFPVFFLILIVVSFMGPSILNIMLALGIFRWTGVSRLVRGEFIRLRGLDFVVASQALGVRSLRIIFKHVLPNALGPVLVAATFAVANGILTESALSYLGFGVKLPVPSWGSLLVETRSIEYWWIQIFPGLLIFATVVLYNLVGEGVRDALDPRLKEE